MLFQFTKTTKQNNQIWVSEQPLVGARPRGINVHIVIGC